ncbi:chromate transporter [Tepidanaerobacter sp. EBM-38]|uniref:chromate transporter n=1 Tax=Tepidanaerobacter sp. EBM-38 TaxID=1918496 RepID=UPI000ABA5567|nr:chromate transporter [Tepidanaerobacter sp. EBM-38]
MIYLQLFLSFMKIGLFSFGGGYAMIPLIQKEIESHGWLSASQFVDIIAIAEMTPGPIAVNSATFVGYKAAGIVGGLIATIGVATPSLVLILIVSRYFFKFQDHPVNKMIFYGIRPVIVGLIFSAAVFVAQTAFLKESTVLNLSYMLENFLYIINFKGVLIFAISLICLVKFKINPILMIVISGILGLLITI